MADGKLPLIEAGFSTFLADGAGSFGAVRQVGANGRPELIVNVEGGGDFRVPLTAVEKVAEKKVILRWDALESSMQEAIRHVLDAEDFPPAGEGEVELVPAPGSEDDDDSLAPRYDAPGESLRSVRDELPGRMAGSRYGAPPSVTTPRRR